MTTLFSNKATPRTRDRPLYGDTFSHCYSIRKLLDDCQDLRGGKLEIAAGFPVGNTAMLRIARSPLSTVVTYSQLTRAR